MNTTIEVRPNFTGNVTVNNYNGIGYTHTQVVASATWTINHNLGYNPVAQVEDSAGDSVMPQKIIQNSVNQMTIEFQGSMSGKAYLS